MIINPEKEAAKEIRRSIVFHEVMSINTFARGRMELVEIRVAETNLAGHSLNELSSLTRSKVLVCAVKRNQEVFIPDGAFTLQKEDKIVKGVADDIKSVKELSKYENVVTIKSIEENLFGSSIDNILIKGK